MKISNDTLSILKNFASINTNILFRKGNTLATVSSGKNIFARASVSETFEREIPIYDLNGLLGQLTLMEDTDVLFGEESVTATKDNRFFEYFYTAPELVTAAPEEEIQVDDFFSFDLSVDDLNFIQKAAGITAAPMLSILGDGKNVTLTLDDPATPKTNNFKQVVASTDKTFKAHLQIENFKVLSGNYRVSLSEKKVLHLINTDIDVKYWLALHSSSEF